MSSTPPRDPFPPAMAAGALDSIDVDAVEVSPVEPPVSDLTAAPTLRGPIDGEVAEELVAVAAAQDCELLLAEFRGGVLRLVLDREDGVTHAHCERVSRQASAVLDVLDFGRGKYVLEVSSPGLDRELYNARDYLRFHGNLARVTFRDPQDEKKKTVIGRIGTFDARGDGQFELIEEILPPPGAKRIAKAAVPATGKTYTIPLSAVQVARLEIEL